MNALAANQIGINPSAAGLIAAFSFPFTAPASETNPVFVNLIGLMLNSECQNTLDQTVASTTTALPQSATPTQIADAMIRSMLGSGSFFEVSSPATIPASGQANLPVDAQNMNSSSDPSANTAAPVPAPAGVTSAAPAPVVRKAVRSGEATLMNVAAIDAPAPMVAALTPTFTPVVSSSVPPVPPQAEQSGPPTAAFFSSSVTSQPTQASTGGNNAPPSLAFQAVLTPIAAAEDAPVMRPPANGAPQATTASAEPAAAATSIMAAATPVAVPSAPISAGPAALSAAPQNISAIATVAPKQSNSQQPQSDDTQPQQNNDSVEVVPATKPKTQTPRNDAPASVPSVPTADLHSSPMAAMAPASTPALDPVHAAPIESPARASASDALRSADSAMPAQSPARSGPVQEISIRIAQPDASPVDLRVVECSGRVHVDVRTNDASMQTSLRQDLGALTNSLQRAGYQAETFTPASPTARVPSGQQVGNQNNQQDSSRNGGSGDFSGGQRQQQQKRTGNWLEEQEDQS